MSIAETVPVGNNRGVLKPDDKQTKNRVLPHSPAVNQVTARNAWPAAAIARLLCSSLLATAFAIQQAAAADGSPSGAYYSKKANFGQERASREARQVADWVVDSGDNRSLPFVIVDKVGARVFVFDAGGGLQGATPALLGLASGDDAVPDIGKRPLSKIRPDERTTPAGRFEAVLDKNLRGREILWVDYDTAISMHPVVTTNPKERRAQRLATSTPLDNRISYGCINVSAKFFMTVVRPVFAGTNGIVYVLPEKKSLQETFASYDVEERARSHSTR